MGINTALRVVYALSPAQLQPTGHAQNDTCVERVCNSMVLEKAYRDMIGDDDNARIIPMKIVEEMVYLCLSDVHSNTYNTEPPDVAVDPRTDVL